MPKNGTRCLKEQWAPCHRRWRAGHLVQSYKGNRGIRLSNLLSTWDPIIFWSSQSLQVWDSRYNLEVWRQGVRTSDITLRRIWFTECWPATSVAGCIPEVTLKNRQRQQSCLQVLIKPTHETWMKYSSAWNTREALQSLCFSGSHLSLQSSCYLPPLMSGCLHAMGEVPCHPPVHVFLSP